MPEKKRRNRGGSAAPHARERRLLYFAALAIFLPVIGLLAGLGVLAWEQVEVSRELASRQAVEALEAVAGERLDELRQELQQALEEQLGPDGLPVDGIHRFEVDAAGRVVAPRLPPDRELPAPSEKLSGLLERLRELVFRWQDTPAALTGYRKALEQSWPPADTVRLLLELLALHAREGRWLGVEAVAERILSSDDAPNDHLLGRRQQLMVELLHLEALARTDRTSRARALARRLGLRIAIEEQLGGLPGANFYRNQLRALAHELGTGSGWMDSTDLDLVRALVAIRKERGGLPPTIWLATWRGQVIGGVPLPSGRFRVGKVAIEPLLETHLELEQARLGLLDPSGDRVFGDEPGTGATMRRSEIGRGPLAGWKLVMAVPQGTASTAGSGLWLGLLAVGILLAGAALWFGWRSVRRAVELVRARADFVAGVTHDLKTPLALIHLYAETLRLGRAADEPEQRNRFLDIILHESERLQDLCHNALRLGRSHEARTEATDLGGTVEAVVDQIHLPNEPDYQLSYRSAGDLPPTPHDPAAIERVLRNLVSNAVKFSPQGGRIRVELERDGEGVLLRVRDEGIGLPPGPLAPLFEPFERDARPEVVKTSGTGLGLTVARDLVEAQGGHISAVRPAAGPGTEMRVWLPAVAAAPAATEPGR